MTDLTVGQLVADLLATARGIASPRSDEWPLLRWQRWIREVPENAWLVMRDMVAQAADDPDVMEYVAYQAPLLIRRDFACFHGKVASLLTASPLLASMVGPEVFVEGFYGPRYRNLDELATAWVRNTHYSKIALGLRDVIKEDADNGLLLALEIIARGPRYGFDADVASPLVDLLRWHGSQVLARIEAVANSSIALRRTIWSLRRQNRKGGAAESIPTYTWTRFQAAAAGTTTYNTLLQPGEATALEPALEELLSHYFPYQATRWASWELKNLVREDPEQGWLAVLAILRQADSQQARCDCGGGPLEDLIRANPTVFVDRVEELAARDDAFKDALACVWLRFEELPESVARRYYEASGRNMRILARAKDGLHGA